jgi:hypothetical protein
MIDPENEIASNNEDNDNPRNLSNQQENFETIETDFSGNDNPIVEDEQADEEGWKTATDASAPSFTLEVEKGISPDPKDNNPPEAQSGFNVKQ